MDKNWMKVQILVICPDHKDVKRIVLLNDYTEALENKSRKEIWFCKRCGRRLRMYYGDYNE